MDTVAQRMENILNTSTGDDKATQNLVDSLNNYLEKSSSKSFNTLILIIITIIGWLLTHLGYINECEVGGIKMSGKILLLALPIMTALLYYRYQCQMLYSSLIEDALFKYYEKKHPNIYKNKLELLKMPPTFMNIETVLGIFCGYKKLCKYLSKTWILLLWGSLVLVPFVYLISVGIHVYFSQNFPLYQKLILLTIEGLFGVRGLLVFVQWIELQKRG